jgi:hypothetical protein
MTARRSSTKTAYLVLGTLATITGMGIGIGGGALVWAHTTQRDAAGFYSTSAERLDTRSFALTSEKVDLGVDTSDYRWVPGGPTAVRIQATSGSATPVFVGIAPAADVDRYLAGSAHTEITDFEVDPFRPELRDIPGAARPAAPSTQSFWAMSSQGGGTQTVAWPTQSGDWKVVVMNADGSAGVAADVAVGGKTGVLLPLGAGMAAVALILFVGGSAMVISGSRGSRQGNGPVTAPARPVPAPVG